jgi:hypothetical protein
MRKRENGYIIIDRFIKEGSGENRCTVRPAIVRKTSEVAVSKVIMNLTVRA